MQYIDERKYTTVASEPFFPSSGTQIATEHRAHSDDMQRTDVISVLIVDEHALMREGLEASSISVATVVFATSVTS